MALRLVAVGVAHVAGPAFPRNIYTQRCVRAHSNPTPPFSGTCTRWDRPLDKDSGEGSSGDRVSWIGAFRWQGGSLGVCLANYSIVVTTCAFFAWQHWLYLRLVRGRWEEFRTVFHRC